MLCRYKIYLRKQNKINQLEGNVNNIQSYIDNNVIVEINKVNSNLSDINQNVFDINNSIDQSLVRIQGDLNESIEDNFYDLFDKFRESADAMSNIFNNTE